MRGLARGKLFPVFKGMLPAAVVGLGFALAPQAANAQFWGGWGGDGGGWGGVNQGDIRQSIGQQGFRVIAPLRRNGAVFVADVLDRRGQRERLIVAAADGQILQRFYLDDPRLPGYVPRNGRALPRDPDEQPVDRADRGNLVPPADIPDAGNGGRAYADPAYAAPNQGSGAQIYGRGDDEDVIAPIKPKPPLKIVKPQRPRVVERSPDTVAPDPQITRRPLEAPAPRQEAMPSVKKPNLPASIASAPNPTPAPNPAPAPPTPSATTTTHLHDPLAIPGGPDPKPDAASGTTATRVIPGVTGMPAPVKPAAPPAKPGDVPVAPLD